MRLFSGTSPVRRAMRIVGSVVLGMAMTGAAVVGFLVLAAQATRT